MEKKRLTGNRNQCRGCSQYFNSITAFEMHRVGHHGIDRRCLTPEEMKAEGMHLREDGFWIGSEMKGYREDEDEATEDVQKAVE